MKVIYAPKTYFKLAKMDYLIPYYQQSQQKIPNELALGGVYEWRNTENKLCVLSPGNFKVPKSDLIPFEKNKYNFHEKEFVYFVPTCSIKEKEYLLLTNKIKIGNKYLIKKIINHFYVTLETNEGEETNPIRFSDITNKI